MMFANKIVVFTTIAAAVTGGVARAQDVPGIEICTAEKTMERRTSCLQSNVNFLQSGISKLTSENQRKLDAAYRQIEALKGIVAGLQKSVEDLRLAQAGKVAPPASDAVKTDGAKSDAAPKNDAVKSGASGNPAPAAK